MKSVCIVLLFVLFTSAGYTQATTFFVKPNTVDANYTPVADSHMVVRNPDLRLNKLFLFIGGTGSNTKQYRAVSEFAGDLGLDVINVAYPNEVAAAMLAEDTDPLAFDKFRQEVCYGTPGSSAVNVDSLNSIYTRTVKLLNYLHSINPSQQWNQYLLSPGVLDWTKIIVGGHSQGGGHACYFSKFHNSERVLMFSSPNDYSSHFSAPATWITGAGITPVDKYFAYLSISDEIIDFDIQLENLKGLGLYPLYDTFYVDNTGTYTGERILYTNQLPGLAVLYHNTTTKAGPVNSEVWQYMLTSPAVLSNERVNALVNTLRCYPNPVTSVLHIRQSDGERSADYTVVNTKGETVAEGTNTGARHLSIDCAEFENGTYILKMNRTAIKFIKQQ